MAELQSIPLLYSDPAFRGKTDLRQCGPGKDDGRNATRSSFHRHHSKALGHGRHQVDIGGSEKINHCRITIDLTKIRYLELARKR